MGCDSTAPPSSSLQCTSTVCGRSDSRRVVSSLITIEPPNAAGYWSRRSVSIPAPRMYTSPLGGPSAALASSAQSSLIERDYRWTATSGVWGSPPAATAVCPHSRSARFACAELLSESRIRAPSSSRRRPSVAGEPWSCRRLSSWRSALTSGARLSSAWQPESDGSTSTWCSQATCCQPYSKKLKTGWRPYSQLRPARLRYLLFDRMADTLTEFFQLADREFSWLVKEFGF